MEQLRQFVSAVLAGFMIGMGGTVFLSQENKALGACMFVIDAVNILVFCTHFAISTVPQKFPIHVK